MTKISNQYSLTNILTADLANSRLGINNVNPTVALDVTGAGKFSSSVTANSYNATTQNIFSVDGSEKMRITSAGFVGIGRTPTTKLDVYSATGNTFSKLESGDNSRVQFTAVNSLNSANFGVESTAGATYIGTLANAALIGSNGNYATQLVTNNTVRLTITSGGSVLVGKTVDDNATQGIRLAGQFGFFSVARDGDPCSVFTRNTNNGQIMLFNFGATTVGSISTNANSLPSDYNFKKHITDLPLGLNLINKLRPVNYRHKIDTDNEPLSNGIIAQEMENALLECSIDKNSLLMLQHKPNEDKTQSEYWVDYTKMIPILIKGIQELSAKISLLENK